MSSKNSSQCAIYGCKNKNQQKQRHLSFYRFPKIKDVARQWVEASKRSDLMELLAINDNDYLYKQRFMVCSEHFENKCFKSKNSDKGLIKTAVPTKNLIPRRKYILSCPDNDVETAEVKVKVEQQICLGCLSTDRRTQPLGELQEMFSTLVGSVLHNDATFCWECIAMFRRLQRFQSQLKKAQNMLTQIHHSLSTLKTTVKDHCDLEIQAEYIDCKDEDVDIKDLDNIGKDIDNIGKDIDNIGEDICKDSIKEENSNKTWDNTENYDFDDHINDNSNEDKLNDKFNPVVNVEVKVKKKLNSWKNIKKEYKSYARHICKDWKKPYTQYFTQVKLDEGDIESYFLRKDRKRQGYKMNFKCKLCSLLYGRKIDLDRHNNLNHHKPNTPYKCLHCKEPQSSLEQLKEHWRSHSVFYKCNACSSAVFPCSLALHLSRSHVNVYACTNCRLTFSSLVSFSEHYNKTHPFICDYCSKRCALRSVLEKHIKNHHTPQHCAECSRTFDSNKLYRAHCRALHPQLLSLDTEPAMCYCVECDAQFPSRALYMKHLNSKHAPKPTTLKRTPCPECGKAFGKNSDMLLHYNFSHVKITKYHCNLCDKYFLKMYGLRTHMENVHLKLPKPKNKICDLCGRAFQSKSVLENHRRTHTGERPFKCAACPAAFAQKGAMRIHQRKQHSV